MPKSILKAPQGPSKAIKNCPQGIPETPKTQSFQGAESALRGNRHTVQHLWTFEAPQINTQAAVVKYVASVLSMGKMVGQNQPEADRISKNHQLESEAAIIIHNQLESANINQNHPEIGQNQSEPARTSHNHLEPPRISNNHLSPTRINQNRSESARSSQNELKPTKSAKTNVKTFQNPPRDPHNPLESAKINQNRPESA